MTTHDVRCTDDRLVLVKPLEEMLPANRRALIRWFWEHDINPSQVAIGKLVERDEFAGSLVWREVGTDGRLVRRWRFASRPGIWPAPFPASLVSASRTPDLLRKRTSS